MRIGFIGNFQVPYTTENDRKWSLEDLGHTVVTLQENETTPLKLMEFMKDSNRLDLVLYSHTHGWEITALKETFSLFKQIGIPTASVHLDRWAWLERVKDMGQEATWFTEYQFMADASPEAVEIYNKLGLNWHFLKAGVVERDCYLAKPDRNKYPHDIIFVGSKGYHSEYPFRRELVDFLHKTYGDRFGHYGNDGLGVVRGDDLNQLYASAKIAVGDSCFGGRPNYVSDRYYETRGRGGFLLHPYVEGIDTVGVGRYEPKNLSSLKQTIDFYLDAPSAAEWKRKEGFEWVKKHETYTERAREMLQIIFEGK